MQDRYVKVRLLDAPYFLDREYDYSVPEELSPKVHAGCFVTVPFGGGNRRRLGLVTAEATKDPTISTKPIRSVSTPRVSLSEEMLGLVCFLREQTLCTTGDAVHAMIPAGALSALTERYRPTGRSVADVRALSTDEAFLLAYLEKVGDAGLDTLRHRYGPAVTERLNNPARFLMNVCPIWRDYTRPVDPNVPMVDIHPFVLNKNTPVTDVEEVLSCAKTWQARNGMNMFIYDFNNNHSKC